MAGEIKALPTIRTKLTPHAIERLAERGITQKMAEKVIETGIRYYDPLNKSIVHVLPNGFGSGKGLLVAVNHTTGEVRTVIRDTSKKLIRSRFIKLE